MRLLKLFLFLLCNYLQLVFCKSFSSELPQRISNDIEQIKQTGIVPQTLKTSLSDLSKIVDENETFCSVCNKIVGHVINHRRNGANKSAMADFAQKLCLEVSGWNKIVCEGYINIEIDTTLYIIDRKKDLTPERVCAIYFQSRNCLDANAIKWTISIPPPRINTLTNARTNYNNGVSSTTDLRVLHLTDFHYDPLYQADSDAVCSVPLCCQSVNGPPTDPKNAAGFWADYHFCDMPLYSLTQLMDRINTEHKQIDHIYYTGDIISHKSWATSQSDNTKSIRAVYKLLSDSFKNVTVYPILGNHEPNPTDFYSPDNVDQQISTQWLFDLVAEEWSRWLPATARETIKIGGYYTVLTRTGLRIIALNSNVCFTPNLWLVYEDNDPFNQLKWLVETLTEAEKNNEKVHILSHIPPGDMQCHKQWSSQFRRIINRFSAIISAQFNGHTHLDEFRVFYDLDSPSEVVNVAFNAGSFTSFVGFNPNYRLYSVDSGNFTVVDYDHYTYNLTKANENRAKSPEWFKLYSFKEAYGMKTLNWNDFGDLIYRMSNDLDLVRQYFRFSVRESPIEMAKGCDEKCLLDQLCHITSVEAQHSLQCEEIKKYYYKNKLQKQK